MIHAFGECELDDELFELRRSGKAVKLEPKVFDVLAYLLRHRERVVTKDELLDALWPGVAVSESVLPKCVAVLRRAVGDTRARPEVIQTVHGRGYRFVADVRRSTASIPVTVLAAPERGDAPSAFLGREQVLERLRSALDEAALGRGRVVVLLGEPGIGKTRTAETLAAEARRGDAVVLTGRSYEGEGAPAFWPWVQILRDAADTPGMAAAVAARGVPPEVAALVPELDRRSPNTHRTESPQGEEGRFRLFDGVAQLLKRAADTQPIVVLLDDLHWADAASLRLLRLLATEIGSSRLLVVATCRDHEPDPATPLAELLGALARIAACEWITLGGLDRETTAALIANVTGGPPPPELSAAVHTMTAGNPFFVQELARLLTAKGTATAADLAAATRALPRRIRDAIRRRLAALSPSCTALLRVAAVLGREFASALLAAVAERSPDTVLAALAEARAARVLDAVGDGLGRYAFHHVLIQQTLYEELADDERARWHRAAGERLALVCGDDADAHLDDLARHFFAAAAGGDVARAVDACSRAAERAHCLLAYEHAAGLYQRALDASDLEPSRDDARRAELLIALGEAQSASGARDAARAAFERAAVIARRVRRADLLAGAALGYRAAGEMGSPCDQATLALLDEALAAVGGEFPTLRARLLSRLAGTPPHSNVMATRARLAREAFALAERAGDTMALRDALSARLWAALGPDHVSERLAVARELLALGEHQRSLPVILLAHDAAFGAHLLRGDLADAERALAAYERTATELRQPTFLFLATFWNGSLALARGQLDAAERSFQSALERGRGTVPYAHFMFAGQMYQIVYLRGATDDPELNRIFFGEMMELPYSFEPAVRSALAFSMWIRGDRAAAREEFERVVARGIESFPRDEHWLVTVSGLSSLANLLGDQPRAVVLYDLLLPYEDLVVGHDLLRSVGEPVASELGRLACALHRYDDGARHYERGLAKASAMGARVAIVNAKAGYAQLLAARGGRGDRARAETLRSEVSAEMAELGLRRHWLLEGFGPSF